MPVKLADYFVSLDTYEKKADANFISHAHADHMSGLRSSRPCLASDATMQIVEAKKGKSYKRAELPKNAKMLSAGHMLGSRQLLIDSEHYGARILYSGDYQMQSSPVAEPIETIETDILILDSTYPYPNIEFEEKEMVISAMQSYLREKLTRGPILFTAFATSKAQEIIRICNDAGIVPLASGEVCRISDIYRKNGVDLEYAAAEGHELSSRNVIISESRNAGIIRNELAKRHSRVFTATASGFARFMRFNTDVQFTLSDHADFKQAISYIERTSPRAIYTCGPSSETFARNLKAFGKNAYSIGSRSKVNELILYNTEKQ